MLDENVLSQLVHRRVGGDVRAWLRRMLERDPPDCEIVVPEIADYELRRELVRIGAKHSLRALDRVAGDTSYAPLTTSTMRRAAELWAEARSRGESTAAPDALDGDVILAAQALEHGATVVTDNVAHLARYVTALKWSDIRSPG